MFILVDTFFRFSGVGLLLLLAILAFRDMRKTNGALYLILACLSVSALFLGYTPEFIKLPKSAEIVVRFLDIPHLIFVWLFALSLFQDQFRLTAFYAAIGIIYCLPIVYVRLAGFGVLPPVPFWVFVMGSLSSVALMGHLVYVTLSGRVSDLRESRRKSRLYFVFIIVFVTIGAALADIMLVGDNKRYIPTMKIITIWPAIVWGCYWLLQARPQALKFASHGETRPITQEMSHRNKQLALALEAEMLGNRAFLEPRLSIAILAKRLGVTPHHLRALINQELGFQNFNVFVNAYRINAIKDAFADPKNAGIPILSIVLDYGFNSLSPFNKAFLEKEGVTPSEYRKSLGA